MNDHFCFSCFPETVESPYSLGGLVLLFRGVFILWVFLHFYAPSHKLFHTLAYKHLSKAISINIFYILSCSQKMIFYLLVTFWTLRTECVPVTKEKSCRSALRAAGLQRGTLKVTLVFFFFSFWIKTEAEWTASAVTHNASITSSRGGSMTGSYFHDFSFWFSQFCVGKWDHQGSK